MCMRAVYCGTPTQAVHIQATSTTCNVTVFDINALYTAVTNPTKPCEQSIYNRTCTVFQGSLLLDISPAVDADGNFLQQKDPKIQVSAFAYCICSVLTKTAQQRTCSASAFSSHACTALHSTDWYRGQATTGGECKVTLSCAGSR